MSIACISCVYLVLLGIQYVLKKYNKHTLVY